MVKKIELPWPHPNNNWTPKGKKDGEDKECEVAFWERGGHKWQTAGLMGVGERDRQRKRETSFFWVLWYFYVGTSTNYMFLKCYLRKISKFKVNLI